MELERMKNQMASNVSTFVEQETESSWYAIRNFSNQAKPLFMDPCGDSEDELDSFRREEQVL
jgi:hypothetical protein